MAQAIKGFVLRAVDPYSNDLAWPREGDVDCRSKRHGRGVGNIVTNPGVDARESSECTTSTDDQQDISGCKVFAGKNG